MSRLFRPSLFAAVSWWLVLLTLCGCMSVSQHWAIYHPRRYGPDYARVLPTNGAEIQYALPFGKQTAFYIPPPSEPPKRVWVAFCGNGSLALEWTRLLSGRPQNRDAFLLLDYPGYGKNSGYATIKSTRATADGAVSALARRLHVDEVQMRLCVIGHSLGCAAALDFAAHHRVDQIVLAAPFTSLREEAAHIVGNPLAHLLTENYDNRENLRAIFKRDPHVRVDIYHGTDDEDIPVQMSRVLAKEFPAIHYHEIPGADHGDVIENAQEQVIAGTSR